MSDAWLWWLFIQMLGLACLPLTFSIFANLPDRGWALSKALGVFSFCFLVWFPLALPSALPGVLSGLALPYSRVTLLVFLLLLLACNGWLLRYRWREIVGVARGHIGYILLCEALFAGGFALLAWLRSFIPDIYGTEKFQDEAFVSAIMRSPHLPPNDPWLSGYAINYYYLGHFIVATLAKLLGTPPAVAFNTGITLIFALTAVNLFGVTSNIVALWHAHRQRRVRAAVAGEPVQYRLLAAAPSGLAAVLLSLVLGNLFGASQWLAQLGAGLSFESGAANVLALLLTAASLYGLAWSLAPRQRRWRSPGADAKATTGVGRLSVRRWIGALAFGAATLALLPWCISRMVGMAGWLGVAWPQMSNWLTHPQLWASYNWWNPSRAVHSSLTNYQNITEFPAFSFLLADLHAHVLALPFTALTLGVALNLLLARGRGLAAFGAANGRRALTLVSAAVIIGGLYAMNGWDLPTYAGLALLCLAAQQWRAHGRRFSAALWQDFLTLAAAGVVLGLVLYLPFIRSFGSPSQGIGLIPPTVVDAQGQVFSRAIMPSDRTSFADFWSVFGLFLTILGAYLLWQSALAFITRWRAAALARQARVSHSLRTAEESRGSADGNLADEGIASAPSGSVAVPEPLDVALSWVVWGLLAVVIVVFLLLFVPYSLVLVTCLVGIAACALLAYRRLAQSGLAFTLMLAGTALALVGVCEVVYLRDVFDHGELFRMNTIFKLYYQAWTLFAVSGGALLSELLGTGWRISREQSFSTQRLKEQEPMSRLAGAPAPTAEGTQVAVSGVPSGGLRSGAEMLAAEAAPGGTVVRPESEGTLSSAAAMPHAMLPRARRANHSSPESMTPGLRVLGLSGKLVWIVGFLPLVLGALVYPVFATDARVGQYPQQEGLDGAAYLERLYPGDAAAIRWINAHIDGDPVIVEATGGEYSDFARVSTFTGLPTVLGWSGHEIQWRVNWLKDPANAADFNQRSADLDTIYTSPDAGLVTQLLHRYQAGYLYVGVLEQQKYPDANLGRFAQFLPVVYQAEGVTIYRIP